MSNIFGLILSSLFPGLWRSQGLSRWRGRGPGCVLSDPVCWSPHPMWGCPRLSPPGLPVLRSEGRNITLEKFDLTFSFLCINKIMVAELIDDSITRNSILYPNNKLWICLTAKCQIALTSLKHRTLLFTPSSHLFLPINLNVHRYI